MMKNTNLTHALPALSLGTTPIADFLQWSLKLLLIGLLLMSPMSSHAEDWIYTTRPGDTLWDISKTYLKKVSYWQRLQTLNNVDVAKQMPPGTRLRIPVEWLKTFAVPANIVSHSGEVSYHDLQSDQLKPLADKKTALIGDTLVTGNNGSALIQFADGSTLLLHSNSELRFDTLSSFEDSGMVDTQVRLQKGRTETQVIPLKNPDSRFEITTPAAVAAVRGTEFRVAYQGTTQLMSSEVVQGKIGVVAAGSEQLVAEGYGNITIKGEAPQPPVKLLGAVDLSALSTEIRQLPHHFKWPGINGAVAYRLRIAMPAKPGHWLVDEMIEEASYQLGSLDDGQYQLTVRAIDDQSLQGLQSRHRFTIDTALGQVERRSPLHQQQVAADALVLSWTTLDYATSYRVQLASDASFDQPLVDQVTEASELSVEQTLPAGDYFWRVAAINNQNAQASYSSVGEFQLQEKNNKSWLLLFFLLPAFI